MMPGRAAHDIMPAETAFLLSTSALYRRPEGSSPSTPASTSSAAASGWDAGRDVVHGRHALRMSPTRRRVTERSPSWVGSTV